MRTYLEHANITVSDIDATIEFLRAIEPDFIVRQDETPPDGYRWVHIGNDTFYIALQQPHLGSEPNRALPTYINFGVNHLAWVVDNLDAVVVTHAHFDHTTDVEAVAKKTGAVVVSSFEIASYYGNKGCENSVSRPEATISA